jgi:hypothetical protein
MAEQCLRPTKAALLYAQGAGAIPVVDAFLSQFSAATQQQGQRGDAAAFLPSAQRMFLNDVLCFPVVRRFPLRSGFAVAVGKRYIQLCEANWRANTKGDSTSQYSASLKQQQNDTDDGEETDDDSGDLDATNGICEELYEWYAEVVGGGGCCAPDALADPNRQSNPISFRSYYLPVPPPPPVLATDQHADSLAPPSSTANDEAEWMRWVHIQVGAQFTNVGLSLWPSAFVLLESLRSALQTATMATSSVAQLLCGTSPVEPPHAFRFIELGSGVGVTGVVLERLARLGSIDTSLVESCVATDYQECIVENALENLRQSSVVRRRDGTAEVKATAFPVSCEILDWTSEPDVKAAVFSPIGPSFATGVILAADCIYDIDVVEDLVNTIRLGIECLRASSARKSENLDNVTEQMNVTPVLPPQPPPCCIVVQTHRQESTMKYFFDRVVKHFSVNSWSVQPRSPSSTASSSLTPPVVSHPTASMAASMHADIVLENMTLKALPHPLAFHELQCRNGDRGSGAAADAASAAALIGPYWVEMPTMICVHRLTLDSKNKR